MPHAAEVYAWMVNLAVASDDAKYRENKQSVFITDGVDLGQLQKEVERRFSMAGRRAEILEIKALGPIGNSKL